MSDSRTETRVERDEDAKREPPAKKPPLSPDLKILESQVLRGPNYWSYEPAIRLLNHRVQANPTFDFVAELESLVLLADRAAFGPSTQAILDEAARRDIPFIRLNDQSFVQLGQGKYQQRIRATMTSRTSALGVDIAGDKKLTTTLLAAAGRPG